MESRALIVHDEFETLRKLAEGYSIARFGDGELKLMRGADAVREPASETLAAELLHWLRDPAERCLRGVLRDHPGPKNESLSKHRLELERRMDPGEEYWSAHISRADHCPWIESREYAELAHALWRGKRAAVIAEDPKVSTYRAVAMSAREVVHVCCPHRETYAQIDRIELEALGADPDVVVMAAGPAATCLANRFSRRGIQALDFGRIGQAIIRNSLQ